MAEEYTTLHVFDITMRWHFVLRLGEFPAGKLATFVEILKYFLYRI